MRKAGVLWVQARGQAAGGSLRYRDRVYSQDTAAQLCCPHPPPVVPGAQELCGQHCPLATMVSG